MDSLRELTFRQTELLQLTWQRFTVNIIFCCTGKNEAEHCNTGFDIATFCKMDLTQEKQSKSYNRLWIYE